MGYTQLQRAKQQDHDTINADKDSAHAQAAPDEQSLLGNSTLAARLGSTEDSDLPTRVAQIPRFFELVYGQHTAPQTPEQTPQAPAKTGSGSSPQNGTGLAGQANISRFVRAAKDVQRRWPLLRRDRRAQIMGDAAGDELEQVGAYRTRSNLTDLGDTSGQFDFTTWTLDLGEAPFSAKAVTDTEAADMADTVYHEARHAEQWHRMARYEAGRGKRAADIASDLGIPNKVASHAARSPLGTDSKEGKEGKRWHRSVYGSRSEHREKVLTDLETLGEALAKAEAKYDQVMADPQSTQQAKDKARLAWTLASTRFDAVYKKYRALPEEADAWSVGGATQAAYLKL